MGRWRSDCWQTYAFTDPMTIAQWATKINARQARALDYNVHPPTRVADYGTTTTPT
eukprot:m.214147 g.214147  ORF g.214147 m.214147 type:complete len:56 (-) comp25578_c0_seq2:5931-6098(-)